MSFFAFKKKLCIYLDEIVKPKHLYNTFLISEWVVVVVVYTSNSALNCQFEGYLCQNDKIEQQTVNRFQQDDQTGTHAWEKLNFRKV